VCTSSVVSVIEKSPALNHFEKVMTPAGCMASTEVYIINNELVTVEFITTYKTISNMYVVWSGSFRLVYVKT